MLLIVYTYQIIEVVINHINPQLSIIDTLFPLSYHSNFNIRELNRKHEKILKGKINIQKGVRIDRSKLPNFKFYDYKPIFKSFSSGDLISIKKPFYLISKPVIFQDISVSIIHINLFGDFGAIYILEKKNGKWIVKDEIGTWYA